ncbi:unnamed protein product, partial [Adineta steineri]
MVKKYVSRRLKDKDLGFKHFKSTKLIDNTVRTSIEHVSTTIEKKLRLSRAQLLSKSTATTQTTIEDEDESVSYDIPYTNVNIIVSINMILDLVNKLRCPSCGRVGKMSEKVTQRRGLLYHITFSCKCSYETHFKNSTELVHSSTSRMDELNMMACVAANVVG